MNDEKKFEYIDGRPIPKYKITGGRDELLELGEMGAITWEYSGFTEQANADPNLKGRTWEGEYLNRPDKIRTSKLAFRVYEKYCDSLGKDVGIDENSRVIEFGCALGRNLIIAHDLYDCKVFGIDICQEVVDKCNDRFGENGEFHKLNMREEKAIEFLKKFDDNAFDLGISDKFLMHIVAGDFKKRLIEEMMRICKGMWIQEKRGAAEREYKIMNSVQTGECFIEEYGEDRLVEVVESDEQEKIERKTMYVDQKPIAWSLADQSYFYVYRS